MIAQSRSNSLKEINLTAKEVLKDYRIALLSRTASLVGRREVLSGKAKFGIFGDGKEVAQVALAKVFNKGDWRSGYYRDQTFMFAIGESDCQKFFAQLYADTNPENEPASSGRQMNSHYATRFLNEEGGWLNQCLMNNSSADLSPTAGQMARLLGLAYASKLYRQKKGLRELSQFSVGGNEVAFGTIGDASTSEGIFWEVLNAAGVLQVPLLQSIWDDGFGISVPRDLQTTKGSISSALSGFQRDGDLRGFEVFRVRGWDYAALIDTYRKAVKICRDEHVPILVHVTDLTQPQGHSTSGSHERYKSNERMKFEVEFDCLLKMREWMEGEKIASKSDLLKIEEEINLQVELSRSSAWNNFNNPMENERKKLLSIYRDLSVQVSDPKLVESSSEALTRVPTLQRRVIASSATRLYLNLISENPPAKSDLLKFIKGYDQTNKDRYRKFLNCETSFCLPKSEPISAVYSTTSKMVDGREVIQSCFRHHLRHDPRLFILGEDVGHLGGVNLEFEGLQEEFGKLAVTDTGIREASILGQGIGCAIRGLRPIVDIQYLDYVLYCFQVMSDDLATLHYRSAGGQIAPVIVRTKGHRLEGIWHTGSPIGMIVNGIRGMHFCVPRNMVQAAGMYNTLLKSDNPALVIEVLNGYRLKERVPDNLHEFQVGLGQPEVLLEGRDLTVVTYGACVRIAEDAAKLLERAGISVELVDVQTLLPFDLSGRIVESLQKTNAVLFFDEDVSGGGTAYMMQKVLDEQNGNDFLDVAPRCLSAADNRAAYGSDGDYFCKPNAEQVFSLAYDMMRDRDPRRFPNLW